jgi:predicted ATPase
MFTSVRFRNFKSLKDFTLRLKALNVLVGPNNAGKSTILDAFRAMAAAHRYASRRVQAPLTINGNMVVGYEIPMSNFPISLDGMTISKPEIDMTYPPRLSMFCKEGRIDREVAWAGFGFQVWLQILTHLTGAAEDNVLVVDEPEIYLHPDLQRRLSAQF